MGATTLQTASGINSYTINLNDFTNPDTISDVTFQNNTPNPAATYTIREARLRGAGLNRSLVETAEDAVKNSFRTAAMWSLANDVPMHLGEFGAFSMADMPSRVRWTTAVRAACEDLNIDWTYWELVAGFGIWDPGNEVWRTDLIEALNPDFGN